MVIRSKYRSVPVENFNYVEYFDFDGEVSFDVKGRFDANIAFANYEPEISGGVAVHSPFHEMLSEYKDIGSAYSKKSPVWLAEGQAFLIDSMEISDDGTGSFTGIPILKLARLHHVFGKKSYSDWVNELSNLSTVMDIDVQVTVPTSRYYDVGDDAIFADVLSVIFEDLDVSYYFTIGDTSQDSYITMHIVESSLVRKVDSSWDVLKNLRYSFSPIKYRGCYFKCHYDGGKLYRGYYRPISESYTIDDFVDFGEEDVGGTFEEAKSYCWEEISKYLKASKPVPILEADLDVPNAHLGDKIEVNVGSTTKSFKIDNLTTVYADDGSSYTITGLRLEVK